jgi:hypothetical protein
MFINKDFIKIISDVIREIVGYLNGVKSMVIYIEDKKYLENIIISLNEIELKQNGTDRFKLREVFSETMGYLHGVKWMEIHRHNEVYLNNLILKLTDILEKTKIRNAN